MADVSTRGVPVSFGSPKFDTIACGPFLVTNAQFPAAHRLEKHFHDRTVLGITVAGEWDSIVGATRLANAPAMLHVEPAGDCHVNQFGSQGAHVVVIQPDQSDRLLEPFKSLLAGAFQIRVGLPGLQIAERLRREIGWQDDLTPLAVESLCLELLVAASRSQGVSPEHFNREFRRLYRMNAAQYIRRLRLEWAAERLRKPDQSLAEIASAAGFADQSHFTRRFKRQFGMTPAAFRVASRTISE